MVKNKHRNYATSPSVDYVLSTSAQGTCLVMSSLKTGRCYAVTIVQYMVEVSWLYGNSKEDVTVKLLSRAYENLERKICFLDVSYL